ncbi:AfsR family transcriptional regulator [Saccharothrix sp. S26]|uniref:BTAD domain-containing putative transcriptional regulator n=1 Tax=Saccharothrix sp. S26 TaxID=2907215 RepID=UPI001F48165C|nr:BTAD domain-containing putative transcriptional regulator [Saccharothrix sp. S26]MCE6997583.1 AfsR family transcriptional regulator [Saccharothrix sp. S26]
MRFGVLGPMVVRRADGTEVRVGGPRLRALLAVLAVEAGRVVGVDRLIGALYGSRPPVGAGNAIQSQVSRLRSLVDVEVERSASGYRLVVDPGEVDALRFEELVARGLPGEALALWRGPALADVGDAPFAAVCVARWEELRLRAVEEHDGASVGLLRELVAAHPTRERLVARLVRVLHREGRQAEALALVERTRRVLAEELGSDLSPVLADAHGEVVRGERPAVRRVLPAQLTSFVGREREVREVGEALASSRLVTLTGPGGAGKTRLAVEVASGAPDEVFFVDLAPLAVGGDVPRAVVSALGLREDGLRPVTAPVARLVAALQDRPVLVVLDNCEHVVEDAAALVGGLLASCARLRVLATSREALGVTGEVVRPVPPLEAGGAGSAAVRLFADRAVAVNPSFRLDPGTAEVVVGICRALDGLPLAIELAAARVRSLPVVEVASRLGDRFRLLSRGSRAAVARHRTLHAVVEWSWGLLDEEERVLARRLTVFRGGATLGSAAAVCGVAGTDEVLPSLADKSLVEVSGDRYRMSETIRAFCARRLAESGEEREVSGAHARYFAGLAAEAAPHLYGEGQLVWLGRLAAEHEDLTAAVRWAAGHERGLALRLAADLGWPWWLRGLRSEGAALAAEVVRAVGPTPPEGLAEEYVLCLVNASSAGLAGLPGTPSPRDPLPAGLVGPPARPFLTVLWGMAHGVPQVDVAGLAVVRERLVGSDPWSRALDRLGAGMQHRYAGRLSRAREEYAAALAGFRAVGERWGMSLALSQLAEAAQVDGGPAAALGFLDEALELSRSFGVTEHTANLLCRRSEWACRAGDLDRAAADVEEAAVVARSQGAVETLALAWLGAAEVARRRGDLDGARWWCAEALRVCPRGWFGPDEVRASVLVASGRVELAGGDREAALRAWGEAAGSARDWGNRVVLARVVEAHAGLAVVDGDWERAALLAGAARGLRGGGAVADPEVVSVEAAAREALGGSVFARVSARGAASGWDAVAGLLGG